ncbi:LysR family transcriptional regulator [Pigmentiphaga aceris]|uniref:LysR family transcriptional regulator n=1 Tax=Pigmentiphaga aceris TaxID=1940612 RepID=A0A5C0B612_9BURK|nr:LysR family transcriptional regulator [Pigmentiphaga aceris]QEI08017.1 LysR family transcriptional regulator [Pigmentiphaga aceris]
MNEGALRYFMEVARSGSLSAASATLHVAISAISRQIAKLEEQVGTPLFERAPRGMVLTDAGRLLLAHARRMALESDAVLNSIASLHSSLGNEIRIACSQGLAEDVLPSAIAAFRKRHPATRFHVMVGVSAEIGRLVTNGDVDLAIAFNLQPGKGVVVRHAQRSPLFAVMSASHPLARRKQITLDDLRVHPLAVTSQATTTRMLLDMACNMAGVLIEPVYTSSHGGALYAFVRDSDAILLAGYVSVAARLRHDGLVAKPIDNLEMQSRSLQVQVMAGRLLPEVIERFISDMVVRLQSLDAATPRIKKKA